jgi:acyl carrier protein
VEATDIVTLVNQIMIDEFEVEPESITSDAELGEDLGLDSLDGVDLVVALEKSFKCRIPEDDARSIRTMGDIYERVESGLARA